MSGAQSRAGDRDRAVAVLSLHAGAPGALEWRSVSAADCCARRPGPGARWPAGFAFVALDPWLSTSGLARRDHRGHVRVGAWAAERTGADLGRPDHGAIVIDEIVAFWIVLLMLPATLLAQALGFLAFRLFDILKPPPIRAVDRRFKNGVGVMADDLIAAFYTLLLAAVAVRLLH